MQSDAVDRVLQALDHTVRRVLYLPSPSFDGSYRAYEEQLEGYPLVVWAMRRLSPDADWVLLCHGPDEVDRVRSALGPHGSIGSSVLQVQAPHALAGWSEAMQRIGAHRIVICALESALFVSGGADRMVDLHNRSLATITVVLDQPAAPIVLERDLTEWLSVHQHQVCGDARDIVALAPSAIRSRSAHSLPVLVRIAAMDATLFGGTDAPRSPEPLSITSRHDVAALREAARHRAASSADALLGEFIRARTRLEKDAAIAGP